MDRWIISYLLGSSDLIPGLLDVLRRLAQHGLLLLAVEGHRIKRIVLILIASPARDSCSFRHFESVVLVLILILLLTFSVSVKIHILYKVKW